LNALAFPGKRETAIRQDGYSARGKNALKAVLPHSRKAVLP
jgi:hypothetical protein